MADRGQITGALLDGPLAFDNAVDPEAARIKGIKSPVAGQAQILVVPDLEAGNMLAKNLTFMAKADSGRHRSRRARSHHSDLASRFPQRPHGIVRHFGALCRRPPPRLHRCGRVNAMDTILVANAGSSSVKFQIFEVEQDGSLRRQLKGQIDGVGSRPRLRASACGRRRDWSIATYESDAVPDVTAALSTAGAWLRDELKIDPIAIGHRVVHGGPDYDKPVRIDQNVLAKLERYVSLAPLHQPYQSCADPIDPCELPGSASDRMLRYRVSSRSQRAGGLLCHTA